MKIYTKTGDAGQTTLYGGAKVAKDETRIRAYGNFDELNSVLGMVLAEWPKNGEKLRARLVRLQNELFQLCAELATPRGKKVNIALINGAHVGTLEKEIDEMEATPLKPLKTFIIPGGSKISAELHFARTVARRAERELVSLHRSEPLRPEVLQYVNRLSDYLFVCARFANHLAGISDVLWVAPKKK